MGENTAREEVRAVRVSCRERIVYTLRMNISRMFGLERENSRGGSGVRRVLFRDSFWIGFDGFCGFNRFWFF